MKGPGSLSIEQRVVSWQPKISRCPSVESEDGKDNQKFSQLVLKNKRQ